MDQARWDHTRLDSNYSFGRPFVDKPSFEGLPPGTFDAARASLFAADRAAADWHQVEFLFERNWFGPCACLGGILGAEEPDDISSSDMDPVETGSLANVDTHPRAGCWPWLFRPAQPPPAAIQQPVASPPPPAVIGTSGPGTALYGAAAAPVPEPAFVSTVQASSPQKAVPVRKRTPTAGHANGCDGPLSPAVAIESCPPPPQAAVAAPAKAAEPLTALLAAPSRAAADDPALSALGPQLGTWADRQYRLLDPVPERGEFGQGSTSGANSVPSSGNNRSPSTPVLLIRNGGRGSGAGSGSGGCGSGSGEHCGGGVDTSSSSAIVSSQAAPASPTLLEVLQQQQQQKAEEYTVRNGASFYLVNGVAANGVANGGREAAPHQQQHLSPLRLSPQHQQPADAVDVAAGRQMDTEALIQEAAWRWRFTRRWQAEQARTGGGPDQAASSAPGDQMEEALAYLQATNATTTVSMQIANVSGRGSGASRRGAGGAGSISRGGGMSMDGSLMLGGMVGTLGAAASTLGGGDLLLGACGSGSGSFTSGPRILGRQASGELLAASREVASLNRRAAAVLQQQMDCELEAERRVQESVGQGPPWVGNLIPIVQIDEWGSFRFLMLKLRDQSARTGGAPGVERQRILIRGHNYGSEGQLMEECNREILALSHKHGLPFEAPTCMGGGVMEWRRDRDRHLHLHSGFVVDRAMPLAAGGGGLLPGSGGAAGRPASAMDLLNLAAALARQSFPPTYKITVLA